MDLCHVGGGLVVREQLSRKYERQVHGGHESTFQNSTLQHGQSVTLLVEGRNALAKVAICIFRVGDNGSSRWPMTRIRLTTRGASHSPQDTWVFARISNWFSRLVEEHSILT